MDPETIENEANANEAITPTTTKSYVYTIRDWKEYLGESLLIIFSVLLALILTEYFNNLHEKENTRTTLKNVVAELVRDKKAIEEMKDYDSAVLHTIDVVLKDKKLQDSLVSNDEFHLDHIAPQGAINRYLDNEAWTIAQNNNVMSKVDAETITILTKVYDDQTRMMKVEDEIAKILFDRASRDPKQVHTTLILIRDIYHAWVVDRISRILREIDIAIKKVDVY